MIPTRLHDIMQPDFPTLAEDTPIRRAVATLVESRAPVAPVLGDDGRMTGLLTQKDCFRPALHASYHQEWRGRVADHMSRNVISVEADAGLVLVAEMFLEHPHRVFPVMDQGRVGGLVHRSDVLAALVRMG